MFKHFVRNTNYCIIVLLTTVESSKDLKQVASGRRGSLNSLQLVSAGFPPFVQLSTTSVVRCNPKSGKCVCFKMSLKTNYCHGALRLVCVSLCKTGKNLSTLKSLNISIVLRRNFTCDELLAPGAPFIKKVLTVMT